MIKNSFLGSFFLSLLFLLSLYPDSGKIRYGILKISIVPKNASARLKNLDTGEEISKIRNKMILPVGKYRLSLSADGYKTKSLDFNLSPDGYDARMDLHKTPRSLSVHAPEAPFSLYIDGKKKLTADVRHIELSKILAGRYDFFIRYKNDGYAYKTIDLEKKNAVSWKIRRFKNRKKVLAWAAATSFLPGINYFIHPPSHWAGFIYPTAAMFYGFSAAALLSGTGAVVTDAPGRPKVFTAAMIAGMGVTSIIHFVLSFLSTRQDLRSLFLHGTYHPTGNTLSQKKSSGVYVLNLQF